MWESIAVSWFCILIYMRIGSFTTPSLNYRLPSECYFDMLCSVSPEAFGQKSLSTSTWNSSSFGKPTLPRSISNPDTALYATIAHLIISTVFCNIDSFISSVYLAFYIRFLPINNHHYFIILHSAMLILVVIKVKTE